MSSKTKHIYVLGAQIKAEPINEELIHETEMVCSMFGCGKILGLQEKLSGSRCINHPIIKTGL